MPLQVEFNFKKSFAAQQLKMLSVQSLFAGLIALLIYCLVRDAIYTGLLEFILLLVLLRARRGVAISAAVEGLVMQNKSAAAVINGSHYPLSACGLDYSSTWLALVSLTTVAGQTYRCCVFPSLLGTVKYRQLIALLKAKSMATSHELTYSR